MRVPGDDQPRAVAGHGVEDPLVGRMGDAQGRGGRVGRSAHRGVVVPVDVRVVDADEVEAVVYGGTGR